MLLSVLAPGPKGTWVGENLCQLTQVRSDFLAKSRATMETSPAFDSDPSKLSGQ